MGVFGNEKDVEKNPAEIGVGNVSYEKRPSYVLNDGAVPGESFEYGDSFYAKSQRLAGKLKIEQRGIERVPENERTDNSHALLNVSTMWLSANMVVSSFAIGVLGQYLFFLGFVDCILVILFFNLLGILPVCFFSSFGPLFGLRQMVLSRFWFGWWPVKLIAIFNILACIGWSSVNSIVGAQLINAVNNDVPGWAGILIIAFCTFFVTLFGYKVVHIYEFWSWIPSFIVFMIVLGEFAHSGAFMNIPMGVGESEIGAVLSMGAVVFGFATGWTSYAADYTVYQPANQSKRKVFWWTWLGLIFPLLFTQMLGAAVITATGVDPTVTDNPYLNGYNQSGNGGLLAAVLFPRLGSFGKFCLVVLALSIIANNCPNIYSVSLTVQVLGRWTQRIPRFIWTFVATAVYIGIAIPGYSDFAIVLENFMNFIGYWLAIYEGISLTEHFVFRHGFGGYNPEHYDHPDKLPLGIAAFAAFCVGVVGMVMGMSQPWFIGPIAKHIGDPKYGGDVGFELGFGFAAVAYLVLRYIERRLFSRSVSRAPVTHFGGGRGPIIEAFGQASFRADSSSRAHTVKPSRSSTFLDGAAERPSGPKFSLEALNTAALWMDAPNHFATSSLPGTTIRTMNASMNARPGALPPSPPASIARSSNGTSTYAVNNNNGPHKYSAQMVEEQLQEHYRVLKDYLEASLRDDKIYQPHSRARDKLLRLSSIQFQELSTDVYDELLRRKSERQMQHNHVTHVPRFLLPKDNFHPKRNQARQKLSTLPGKRFRELAADVLYELERRTPRLAGADIERVASPARSTTSSMRNPGGRSPRSRPTTGTSINAGTFPINDRIQQYGGGSLPPPYSPAVFENGSRDMPGSSSGTEFARPLPKTFKSNNIVSNKSTIVEDYDILSGDEESESNAFHSEAAASRSGRQPNNSLRYPVGDMHLTLDYQAQVEQLEVKVVELETQLRGKHDELKKNRDALENQLRGLSAETTNTIETERTRSANLCANLDRQLKSAEHLNVSLQSELEKLRASNTALQSNLHQRMNTSNGVDEWKFRYENLEKEFNNQKRLTDEVRREAHESLQEMKILSQRSSDVTAGEHSLLEKVSQLEASINHWKGRYAITKSALRDLRAQSMTLNVQQFRAAKYAEDGDFLDPQGFIRDVSVTRFQIAIDELLHLARSHDPGAVLEYMRTTVNCVRGIFDDIDAASASVPEVPEEVAKRRAKLKPRVSATANDLITAAKNHASSNGLSPVSLVDAAASNLTMAVVELIKGVKIRPTPSDELEVEGYVIDDADGNIPLTGATSTKGYKSINTNGNVHGHPEQDPPGTLVNVAAATENSPIKQLPTLLQDDDISPAYRSPLPTQSSITATNSPALAHHHNDPPNPDPSQTEPQPPTSNPSSSTPHRNLTTNARLTLLRDYLEDQTASLLLSIQPLIHTIRAAGTGAATTNVALYVSTIAATVQDVVATVSAVIISDTANEFDEFHGNEGHHNNVDSDSRAVTAALEKHVLPLVRVLEECCAQLLWRPEVEVEVEQKHKQAGLPAVAGRIARAMRCAGERVEGIEGGWLTVGEEYVDEG